MITVLDAKRGRGGAQAAPVGPEDRPRTIGPFALVGHIMRMEIPPGTLPVDMDVRAHPHIGLAAISYVLDGSITHRDNLGNRREIGPGAIGYMIAGRGVVHSERFERLRVLGGAFEMFQILMGLPDGSEEMEPSFAYVEVPEVEGRRTLHAAVDFPGPLLLDDVRLAAGARYELPAVAERAVYVLSGDVAADGALVRAQQIALGPTAIVATTAARVLAFGGDPLGPRFMWWNYIDSSLARIEAAKAAWRAERVPRPAGDTESFTPAPPDDGRPLVRLNAQAAE
jgi:redox-sensitive bicupin YhaK (pirin superfamily)